MTRRITVVSPLKNNPQVYNTSARTWGELRPYVEADLGNLSNMKAVVKDPRQDLDSDSAVLPVGNCIILMNQVNIKAGVQAAVEAITNLRARFVKVITETVSKLRKK